MSANIANNTVDAGSGNSGILLYTSAGTVSGTVTGNTTTNATTDGIATFRAGGGSITLNASENTSTNNINGFYLHSNPSTVDLGGGSLGSIGENRVFNSSTADIENDTGAVVSAVNNWFG